MLKVLLALVTLFATWSTPAAGQAGCGNTDLAADLLRLMEGYFTDDAYEDFRNGDWTKISPDAAKYVETTQTRCNRLLEALKVQIDAAPQGWDLKTEKYDWAIVRYGDWYALFVWVPITDGSGRSHLFVYRYADYEYRGWRLL